MVNKILKINNTAKIIRIIHYLNSFDITQVMHPNQTCVSAQFGDNFTS